MSNQTTVQQLRQPAQRLDVAMGFGSLESFELMQRGAKLLSSSTLVPAAYRAVIEKTNRYGEVTESRQNPNALANCVVALNMAQRMGADPLMVMQNLYIVEGRPSWSSQWIIAAINGCGRFSPLRFDIKNLGTREVEYTTFEWSEDARGKKQRREVKQTIEVNDKVCVAWAVEAGVTIPQFELNDLKEHGGVYGCCKYYGIPLIESPEVSIDMAVKEGWYTKNGSKWQTMPDVMLRYRTASFFGKLYAPELLMGLQTTEEVMDTLEATTGPDGTIQVDVEALRTKGNEEPSQPKNPPKATDAEFKTSATANTTEATNTREERAKAEAGKPAPEAGSSAPASEGQYLDHAKVLASIERAQDHDTLAVAADSIQDCHPEEQEDLAAAYRQRLDQLDDPRQASGAQSKPTRTRRAVAADME